MSTALYRNSGLCAKAMAMLHNMQNCHSSLQKCAQMEQVLDLVTRSSLLSAESKYDCWLELCGEYFITYTTPTLHLHYTYTYTYTYTANNAALVHVMELCTR